MRDHPILFSGRMVRRIIAGAKTQTRRIMNPQPAHVQRHEYRGQVLYDAEHRLWWWKQHSFENLIDFDSGRRELAKFSPYGNPGDRLWVRETWALKSIDPLQYLYGPLASIGIRKYGGGDPTPGCHLRWHGTDAMVEYAEHPTSYEEIGRSPGYTTYRNDSPRTWRSPIHMPRWASRITLDVTAVRVERLHDITEEDAKAEGAAARIAPGGDLAGAFDHVDTPISYRNHFADLWRDINGAESWDANPWVWVVTFNPFNAFASRAA